MRTHFAAGLVVPGQGADEAAGVAGLGGGPICQLWQMYGCVAEEARRATSTCPSAARATRAPRRTVRGSGAPPDRRRAGASPVPGLFFVGRSWQTTRGSARLLASVVTPSRSRRIRSNVAGRVSPTVVRQACEVVVDVTDRDGAIADGRRDPLRRASPGVADGEHPGQARLDR
jgi:hypothetical protein